MKFTREQVLQLKNNADQLLKRMDAEEKDQYKLLAKSYDGSQAKLDQILSAINNNKTYEQVALLVRNLKAEIGDSLKAVKFDAEPVVKAVSQLNSSVLAKKDYDASEIVLQLKKLESLLGKPQAKDRTDEIIKAIKAIKLEVEPTEFPEEIAISEIRTPFPFPTPVTNFNLNPLRGFIHTTAQTLTTTLAQIPSYGVLDNRRAIMIYNAGSNTIYIGGSDVTASNGMPVTAGSYSPILDAGIRMKVYGLTSSSTSEIRVMEISNENTGG